MKIIKSAGYIKSAAKFEIQNTDGTISLDFAAAEAWAKSQPEEVLRYSIQDSKSALEAMPEYLNPPLFDSSKAGFYQDEVHVYASELQRRMYAGELPERKRHIDLLYDDPNHWSNPNAPFPNAPLL